MDKLQIKNVYVINLDRDTKRLATITSNLNKYNIKFHRISAVEGKKLSTEDIHKNTTPLCRTLLCSKGIIGSGLSHMKTWNLISKSQERWHLVLEDDVEFTDNSIVLINTLYNNIKDTDIDALININCHNPHELFCRFTPLNKILSFNFFATGASAYLITPSAANVLLNRFDRKITGYIDGTLGFSIRDDKYLITNERYVYHNFNVYDSSNMKPNIMPILTYILTLIGYEELAFFFNVPLVVIKMNYEINIYLIIFLTLLFLNIIYLNIYIFVYMALEIVLYFILIYNRTNI